MYIWPDLNFPPINLWSAPKTVKTSCQNRCKLDETRTYCLGCGRTLNEIIEKGKQHGK